jgi:hypothetical protein
VFAQPNSREGGNGGCNSGSATSAGRLGDARASAAATFDNLCCRNEGRSRSSRVTAAGMDSTQRRRAQPETRPLSPWPLPAEPGRPAQPGRVVLPAAPGSASHDSLRFGGRTDRTGTGRTGAVDTRTRWRANTAVPRVPIRSSYHRTSGTMSPFEQVKHTR